MELRIGQPVILGHKYKDGTRFFTDGYYWLGRGVVGMFYPAKEKNGWPGIYPTGNIKDLNVTHVIPANQENTEGGYCGDYKRIGLTKECLSRLDDFRVSKIEDANRIEDSRIEWYNRPEFIEMVDRYL